MFHSIYLRTSSQATEDPEKVRTALRLFLPQKKEPDESDMIQETITSGHHGNQILVLEAEIKRKKEGQYVIDSIRRHLGSEGLSRLIAELPRRVDEDCNLYIRFDKQEASKGRLAITQTSDAILIRIKLKAYPARQAKALQVAQDLFTGEI